MKTKMNVEIRLEEPADYRRTENMTREAFWNHYSPGCIEHYLLHIMRDCPAFVPELDFVAVHDGEIVGNAVCLQSVIRCDAGQDRDHAGRDDAELNHTDLGDAGRDLSVLSLGPISVLPACQGRGIGGQLLERSKQAALELGFRAILLYGDPAYYARHGFIAAELLGIRGADDMYAAAHQVCELYSGALAGVKGRHINNDIYEVDEAAVAVFDKNFPAKEKTSGTASQQRLAELLTMCRPAF